MGKKKIENVEEEIQLEQEDQSQFNEALSQLQRIGDLWEQCHTHRSNGKLSNWNVGLDAVYLELIADCDPEDKKKIVNINSEYVKNKNNKYKTYQVLMKKEEILRVMQSGQGKGSTKKENNKGL